MLLPRPRRLVQSILLGAVVTAAACAIVETPQDAASPEPTGPPPPRVQVLAVADAEARAQREGLHAEPLRVPIEAGASVDAVVPELMRRADERGARYLSGIAMVSVEARDGRALTCTTRVMPRAELETVSEPVEVPARTEQELVRTSVRRPQTRWVRECKTEFQPVTRTRTQLERECSYRSRPRTRTRTVYERQYDFSSKSYRSVPRMKTETVYESEYECRSVPRTKMVTERELKYVCDNVMRTEWVTDHRWETETTFVPPKTEWTVRSDWRWTAAVSPAVCTPAPEGGDTAASGGRMEATIWLPGASAAAAER